MPLEQEVFPILYFNNDMTFECAIITLVVATLANSKRLLDLAYKVVQLDAN